jgi:hypothetical protein
MYLSFVEQCAHGDMTLFRQTFFNEIVHFDSHCHDWAAWDEDDEFAAAISIKRRNRNLAVV